jgi:class 3 adenylate cyclase
MSGRFETSFTATIRAPRALVWAMVCDTNRLDRALGLVVPRYEWHKEGARNLRLARASELGVALEWIEPPYEWAEGEFVRSLRRYRRGPVEEAGFAVSLRDVPGGTELTASLSLVALWYIQFLQRVKLARGLRRYVQGIEQIFAGAGAELGDAAEPPLLRAKRLFARGYQPATCGPRSPTDAAQLEARARRVQGASPELLGRLVSWLREQPDDDVAQMRPFELARLWGEDRREVLRTFLRATEAGLVELQWQVNCPVCRVGARIVPHLDQVGASSHCGACEIDYGVDFARHVEAVFPCHPALRAVQTSLYCASSPAFLPHVTAQFRPAAGQVQEERVVLPTGPLLFRTQWVRRAAEVTLDATPAELTIRIDDDALSVEPKGRSEDGATRLRIDHRGAEETALLVERVSWNADAVLGTVIASLPEFVNLFATEAPALGVELKVGFVALLFSDLTGSTALYERIGDARAFAVVEEHFRVAEAVVAAHGGAVVKTMGDAVMASFPSLPDAAAAGIAMVRAHDARFAAEGLTMKVGVHGGPCLVVRANDRLDYFGTTVNVAARLQAQAGPSEIVLTEENAADEAIAPRLAGLSRRPFAAKLKGIRDEQRLVALGAGSPTT